MDRRRKLDDLDRRPIDVDRLGLSSRRLTANRQSQRGTYTPPMEEYRRHLVEALHSASRDYDQAVITLASAILAVSVTFSHDITPTPVEGSKPLLLLAWLFLIGAVIATVFSFLTSQKVLRDTIASVDLGEAPRFGRFATATVALNLTAGTGLVGGLILLGLYALQNS